MTDDTWWAFIAGIDKQQLIRELPGSADDRRMRREHAEHVAALKAERDIDSAAWRVAHAAEDRAHGNERLDAAAANARGYTARYEADRRRNEPLTQTERDIAAYAARKRGHAA